MTEQKIRVDDALSIDRMREIGLFGALSDDVLRMLATQLKQVRVTAGSTIFAEGDTAREMYVVLDGEVEVLKSSKKGRVQRVALLGPNDTFGEMSIIDVQPRSATVRAVAPVHLLRVAAEDLDALYRHDLRRTLITLNLARELSRRRVTDRIWRHGERARRVRREVIPTKCHARACAIEARVGLGIDFGTTALSSRSATAELSHRQLRRPRFGITTSGTRRSSPKRAASWSSAGMPSPRRRTSVDRPARSSGCSQAMPADGTVTIGATSLGVGELVFRFFTAPRRRP